MHLHDHEIEEVAYIGDCYCEDEAKTMVQKMLNLVEVIGEGFVHPSKYICLKKV